MSQSANEFVEAEQRVTSEDLDEVERLFHFIFPENFREHYLAVNGGSPRRCLFAKNGQIYVVNRFFPVKYGRTNSLFEDRFRQLKIEEDILPKCLIAFADDPGGDFYCFSIREHEVGTIWSYIGEYSDEPERAVAFLANSLPEFIENMYEDKD